MPTRLATLLAVGALLLTACGSEEEQAPQAQRPPGGGQPPAEQAQPPSAALAGEQSTGEELVRESAAAAEIVARAARRLVEDPEAEVLEELDRAQERARALNAQLEQPVEGGRQRFEQEPGSVAGLGLLRLNERTAVAAERLRLGLTEQGIDEDQLRQIARQELARLRDEIDTLRDTVPSDLRDSVDRVRDRLRQLTP
ncbi:MAG TPA: hypothetical protein VGV40_01990 [Solirubrobacteraceae bacterium]|nr:hypothetical protein [Solirubrobacteraceae bacterium]